LALFVTIALSGPDIDVVGLVVKQAGTAGPVWLAAFD
jgi:hypothetical protein